MQTVLPPVRVKVRENRHNDPRKAKVRGRIAGAAFDGSGNLWAYAVLDESAPLVSPYGVNEMTPWPVEGDELIAVVQGWHLVPNYGGVQVDPGLPIFVYVQTLPEDDDE